MQNNKLINLIKELTFATIVYTMGVILIGFNRPFHLGFLGVFFVLFAGFKSLKSLS